MENTFFFKNDNYNLFGILHEPDSAPCTLHPTPSTLRNIGIVFCHPFAEEKLWSHRVFVNFARKLTKVGYTVLRFDYMGHGDSEGNFEDSTIESRTSDIARSVEVIKEKANVSKVGLLGLRLGATLAAISVEAIEDINFLILWEPVIRLEDYLQQCLRSNLATQLAVYKKIIQNRKEMTEDLLNGKPTNIDGYLISGDFYKQASKIDLINYTFHFSKPVQIVHIAKNEKQPIKKELKELYEGKYKQLNQHSQLSKVVEDYFWNEIKTYYQEATNVCDETLSWLAKISL